MTMKWLASVNECWFLLLIGYKRNTRYVERQQPELFGTSTFKLYCMFKKYFSKLPTNKLSEIYFLMMVKLACFWNACFMIGGLCLGIHKKTLTLAQYAIKAKYSTICRFSLILTYINIHKVVYHWSQLKMQREVVCMLEFWTLYHLWIPCSQ